MDFPQSVIERFWSKVEQRAPHECWEWKGAISSSGYGAIQYNKKTYTTHRFAWIVANKRLPLPDQVICHACDNRPCCNPRHLWAGSYSDNLRDAYNKGRHLPGGAKGEENHSSVLLRSQVAYIKRLQEAGYMGIDIAAWYGVSTTVISDIRTMKIWKHEPPAVMSYVTISL